LNFVTVFNSIQRNEILVILVWIRAKHQKAAAIDEQTIIKMKSRASYAAIRPGFLSG
jgi:hypothetical protein